MDPVSAILAFSLAAALMTVTPGLDTALVLRTATVEGPRPAMAAAAGIVLGCLVWALVAVLGLGAVLAVSELGYRLLQLAGAAWLCWLGARLLLSALRPPAAPAAPEPSVAGGTGWFWRGLLTNLLNPKVGVFYLTLLPPFIPQGVPAVAFGLGLALIHSVMGIAWFAAIVTATQPFARLFRGLAFKRATDAATGAVLIGFGLRLALERRG